jgi:c-di-GMP-binding flagellar brake protein YcgR
MPFRTERRRFERRSFFAAVKIEAASGPSIEARSDSISLGGVGLLSPTPLARGEGVELTIRIPGGAGTEERVSGRVASLRSDDDCAIIGVEFSSPLDRRSTPALVRAVERL